MEGAIYALGNPSPDVDPTAMDIPEFITPISSIVPTVTVRNYRSSATGFDVAVEIDLDANIVYADTVNVANLAGGDSVNIGFALWVVGPDADKYYNINISTILAGDENINNDTLFSTALTGEPFVCGDGNGDGVTNIFDITFLISHLYLGGSAPDPLQSADVNHDGNLNIFDITYLIAYLYLGGSAPNCL